MKSKIEEALTALSNLEEEEFEFENLLNSQEKKPERVAPHIL